MKAFQHSGTRCKSYFFAVAALSVLFSLNLSAQSVAGSGSPAWAQWGLNPQHTLDLTQTAAQPLNKNLVNIVYDQIGRAHV